MPGPLRGVFGRGRRPRRVPNATGSCAPPHARRIRTRARRRLGPAKKGNGSGAARRRRQATSRDSRDPSAAPRPRPGLAEVAREPAARSIADRRGPGRGARRPIAGACGAEVSLGRLGSVLVAGSRLRRVRGRFPSLDTYQARCLAAFGPEAQVPKVLDPELSGEPQVLPHAVYATTPPQIYPRGSPGADLDPKKVNNLGPMAPRSRKKRQLPEAPQ